MPSLPPTSRRAAVTVGTVTVGAALHPLLAACDVGDVGDALPGREEEPAGPSTAPDPTADQALVAEAADDVVGMLETVTALRVRHPRLRRSLAGLERLHLAHAEALEAAPSAPAARPTDGAEAALALVRRLELAHRRRLADRAVRADSGGLARLLASMSAGVAQHLAALPQEAPEVDR